MTPPAERSSLPSWPCLATHPPARLSPPRPTLVPRVRSGNEASSNATAVALSAQLYAPSVVSILDSSISGNGRNSARPPTSTLYLSCAAGAPAGFQAPAMTPGRVLGVVPHPPTTTGVDPACLFQLRGTTVAGNVAGRHSAAHVSCPGVPCALHMAGNSFHGNEARIGAPFWNASDPLVQDDAWRWAAGAAGAAGSVGFSGPVRAGQPHGRHTHTAMTPVRTRGPGWVFGACCWGIEASRYDGPLAIRLRGGCAAAWRCCMGVGGWG
jgi:hypothetical protein